MVRSQETTAMPEQLKPLPKAVARKNSNEK